MTKQPDKIVNSEEEVKAPRQRSRDKTGTELKLALHRLQRAGKKVSISSIAKEAGVSAPLIHGSYPEFAEQVRELNNKSTRTQLGEKRDRLHEERKKNSDLRALLDREMKDAAMLASVNEALRAEIILLKALADGKVLKGDFGSK